MGFTSKYMKNIIIHYFRRNSPSTYMKYVQQFRNLHSDIYVVRNNLIAKYHKWHKWSRHGRWKYLNTQQHRIYKIHQDQDLPREMYSMYNVTQIGKNTHKTFSKPHIHVMMTQISMKEGIRKFGNIGNNALLKELNSLHQQQGLLLR